MLVPATYFCSGKSFARLINSFPLYSTLSKVGSIAGSFGTGSLWPNHSKFQNFANTQVPVSYSVTIHNCCQWVLLSLWLPTSVMSPPQDIPGGVLLVALVGKTVFLQGSGRDVFSLFLFLPILQTTAKAIHRRENLKLFCENLDIKDLGLT